MGVEWSLVVFTILAQASIGLMIAAQSLGYKERSQIKIVLPWVGLLMVLSMIASLGHLGSPLGAPRAILNIKNSWLSREIFFAVGFLGLWFVSYLAEGRENLSDTLKSVLGWSAVLVGILTLVSMGAIYASTILPAWGTAYTYLSFFSTALALGFLLYAILIYRANPKEQAGMLKVAFYLVAVGVVIQLASLAPYLVSLSGGDIAAQSSAQLLINATPALALSQILAVLGGIIITFRFANSYQEEREHLSVRGLYGALFLVLISVVTSRYLFYATGVGITVGQF